MSRYKLYVVEWIDAWATDAYYNETHDFTPIVMTDVGWLCENNDETIVLCQSYSETGRRRTLTTIPHINVVSIVELV